jgi:hypothetical protein
VKASLITKEFNRHRDSRGIALLLTLGILLLLTLLALGFSSSQLTESQAARNFYYTAKAEEIALGGLESAIGVLREDSSKNSYDHLRERWAIYYDKDDGFAGDEKEDADLSDFDEFQYDVDESGVFRDPFARKDPWKDPQPDSRWIEVRAVDPGSGENRLVGRYAVSIEDENAKVNINMAGNPEPEELSWRHRQRMGFSTAEIDLGAIFENLGGLFDSVLDNVSDYPYNVSNETARDIVAWRYGWRRGLDKPSPGEPNRDDNRTSQMETVLRQDENGIDDDADGLIDETSGEDRANRAEEDDEPGEFDPYKPMAIGPPGQIAFYSSPPDGITGIMGDDTPFLTVPQIKMCKSVRSPSSFSIRDKDNLDAEYPKERQYNSLLPYITVYSQDLNCFSNRDVGTGDSRGSVQWMMRENIGRWLYEGERAGNPAVGASEVYDFLDYLKRRGVAFRSTNDDVLRRIAVNIYDFCDPDWFPTPYRTSGGQFMLGVEPTLYLNEVDPTPPDVPGTELGFEGWVLDWGEYIELWNPYDVPLDVTRYSVTIDSGGPTPIANMQGLTSTTVPPRGFFLIGDTRGYCQNSGNTGLKGEQSDLPGRPQGCNAYAPLKLDDSLDMVFEMRLDASHVRVVEEHDNMPTGNQFNTVQKDDPREPDWKLGTPSPRALNATVTAPGNVYTHFYMPGVRVHGRKLTPPTAETLFHAGALSNIGELGMVYRGQKWSSLDFTMDSPTSEFRDDVNLLDLITLPHQYTCPMAGSSDRVPPRLSVPGRININTAPPEILLGLNWDPMFEELNSYGIRLSSGLRWGMIEYILQKRPYRNLADFAKVMAEYPSIQNAPEGAREAFMRYNANLITTKSSVFKITVLAEAVGRSGDVVATRKLEAVVDRGYTPGSFNRPDEKTPSALDRSRTETARVLHFRWITED